MTERLAGLYMPITVGLKEKNYIKHIDCIFKIIIYRYIVMIPLQHYVGHWRRFTTYDDNF